MSFFPFSLFTFLPSVILLASILLLLGFHSNGSFGFQRLTPVFLLYFLSPPFSTFTAISAKAIYMIFSFHCIVFSTHQGPPFSFSGLCATPRSSLVTFCLALGLPFFIVISFYGQFFPPIFWGFFITLPKKVIFPLFSVRLSGTSFPGYLLFAVLRSLALQL